VRLRFAEAGITRLAEIAHAVNERAENIGARRLHTVMEKLLEDISFDTERHLQDEVVIDAAYVDNRLKELSQREDLARYVL
jgi:ATP-dependent HslUV protease ATP-binding subunit HslU